MPLDPADLQVAFGLAPEQAVAYFNGKGYKITGDWHEMLDQAHAKAFTVANVAKIDILQDIRSGLEKALKEGQTERWFIQNLTPILQAKGWWGREERTDTGTGEIRNIQLGSPERLRTIYRTNLQSAYQAGRWKAFDESADSHPYLQYVAVMDAATRPSHAALNGRIFRIEDPIWKTCYPPNGYNCRCRTRPMSESALEREGGAWSSSEGLLSQKEVPLNARDRTAGTATVTVYKAPGMDRGFSPDVGFNANAGVDWAAPFTPPPLDTLPRTFSPGVALPELPAPNRVPVRALLSPGLPPEDYAKAFLTEFEAVNKPVVFKDVTGAPLVIDDGLFHDGSGAWKADKNGRGPYMTLLAGAIKEPDEIWLRWEESRDNPGSWLLKRRYIKAWEIQGATETDTQYGLSVFEIGKDGWSSSTAMIAQPDRSEGARKRYIEKQRDGFLLFRKKPVPPTQNG